MEDDEILYKLTTAEFEQLAGRLLAADGLGNVTYVGGPNDQSVDFTAEQEAETVAVQVRLRAVVSCWWLGIVVVTVVYFAVSLSVVGGAINSKNDDGRYFVVDYGQESEVFRLTFYTSAGLELLAFMLVPGGFYLAAVAGDPGTAQSAGRTR